MEIGNTGSFTDLSGVVNRQPIAAPKQNNSAINPSNNQANQDTVTLTPQAQIIQKVGDNNEQRLQSATSDQEENSTQVDNDFVRVSSSVGKAASSYGLSQQEAIALYEQIDNLV